MRSIPNTFFKALMFTFPWNHPVAKVRKYQGWVDSYRQNRLFENNKRQFYRELDQEEERCDGNQPVAEESKQF